MRSFSHALFVQYRVCLLLIFLILSQIPCATAATTDPSNKDSDNDLYCDGPDRLVEEGGQWYVVIGEDKNGNGRFEREGADGIIGTVDDETDPNNAASHPQCPHKILYEEAASWHDFDGDGIPDAQEDVNLNGQIDDGETDRDEIPGKSQGCSLYFYDAEYLGGMFSPVVTRSSDISVLQNWAPSSQLASVYWQVSIDSDDIGNVRMQFHYTDDEIHAGQSNALNKDQLLLYQSDSLEGPWRRLPVNFSSNKSMNTLAAWTDRFGYFAIVEEPISEGVGEIFVGKTRDTKSIQEALDKISPNGTITVDAGTPESPVVYNENLVFPYWLNSSLGVTLTTTEPENIEAASYTVIDAGHKNSVVCFYGDEGANTCIKGFTIANGCNNLKLGGGGIQGQGSHVTLERNRITNNQSLFCGGGISDCDGSIQKCLIANNTVLPGSSKPPNGGGIFGSDGSISYCTIYGNDVSPSSEEYREPFVSYGGGLSFCMKGSILNCIIWGNSSTQGNLDQIYSSTSVPNECCIEAWQGGVQNSSAQPAFAAPIICDFRIQKDCYDWNIGSDDTFDPNNRPADVMLSVDDLVQSSFKSDENVTLSWTRYSANNIQHYYVYRGSSPDRITEQIADITDGAKFFTDLSPIIDAVNYYAIQSKDSSGRKSPISRSKHDSKIDAYAIAFRVVRYHEGQYYDDKTMQKYLNKLLDYFKYNAIVNNGEGFMDVLNEWRSQYPLNILAIFGHATPYGYAGTDYTNGLYYPTKCPLDGPFSNSLWKDENKLSPSARLLDYHGDLRLRDPGSGTLLVASADPIPGDKTKNLKYRQDMDGIFNSNSIILSLGCNTGENLPYNYRENPDRFLTLNPIISNSGNDVTWMYLCTAPFDEKERYGYITENAIGKQWWPTSPAEKYFHQDNDFYMVYDPNTTMENPHARGFAQNLSSLTGAWVIGASGQTEQVMFWVWDPVYKWKSRPSSPLVDKKSDSTIHKMFTNHIERRWNEKKCRTYRPWRIFHQGSECSHNLLNEYVDNKEIFNILKYCQDKTNN